MRGDIIKKLLAESFEELILQKKIEEISVNDIISAVGISRTTFYRHFSDKYDLLNWIYSQYMKEWEKTYSDTINFRQFLIELLRFFYVKRRFFTKIMYYTGQNSFYMCFFDTTSKYISQHMLKDSGQSCLSQEDECIIRYHCGGILRIAYDWIELGCSWSPEELADIMLKTVNGRHSAYSLPFFKDINL